MDTIIELYEGSLGGGKTYSVVEEIFKIFLRGGIVYTNIELKFEAIKASALLRGFRLDDAQYVKLTNEQVKNFNRHVSKGSEKTFVCVALDEAHLFFNSRDYAKTSREVLETLTQMRKVEVNLKLITQSRFNLDKQFVRMVHIIWQFRDMRKLTIPFIDINYPFDQILQLAFDGNNPKIKLKQRMKFKDPEIFSWYESKALFTDLFLKDTPIPPNVVKLTKKEMWNHRLSVFRKSVDAIKNRKDLKQIIMRLVLIIIVVSLIGFFSIKNLLKKDEPSLKASPEAHRTHSFLGGGGGDDRKNLSFYVSNYSAIYGGQRYVRGQDVPPSGSIEAIHPATSEIATTSARIPVR